MKSLIGRKWTKYFLTKDALKVLHSDRFLLDPQ